MKSIYQRETERQSTRKTWQGNHFFFVSPTVVVALSLLVSSALLDVVNRWLEDESEMVLKNFVRYIINKCLSAHVEELDCEKFDVDLRNGKESSSSEMQW